MTLQELGLAITSKVGCSPLLGQHVARTLLDEFNSMLAAGYQLSVPQLCRPTRPGHTTWRIDIANPRDGFAGALIFCILTID
jgi:hypothetical protein